MSCFDHNGQPKTSMELIQRHSLTPEDEWEQQEFRAENSRAFPVDEEGKTILINSSEFVNAVYSNNSPPSGMNVKKSLARFILSKEGMSERDIADVFEEKQQTTHRSLKAFRRFLANNFSFDFSAVLPKPEFSSSEEEEIVNACRSSGDWTPYENFLEEQESAESEVTNE